MRKSLLNPSQLLCILLLVQLTVPIATGTSTVSASEHNEHVEYMQTISKQYWSACVNDATGSVTIKSGSSSNCPAWGYYSDEIATTGWGYLSIETSSTHSDTTQAYAAGFLEGYLTAERIIQSKINIFPTLFNDTDTIPPKAAQYIAENWKWLNEQVVIHSTDSYWKQIHYIIHQINGMIDGMKYANQPISLNDMLYLQAQADMGDIINSAIETARPKWFEMPLDVLIRENAKRSHCSALIKLNDDRSELLVGHTTWSDYSSMLRIFKLYHFSYSNTPGIIIHFSSYPALIQSTDDFYQIYPTMLAVTETTMDIYNMSMYDVNKPQSVFTYMRAIVANRLANTASEWISIASKYPSGTYCNEWMVVDYNRFTPGSPLPANTVMIVEQLPGMIESKDISNWLNTKTYWPSYNVPYFPDIYVAAGYAALVTKYGPDLGPYLFSYQQYFRAQIFKRDHLKVQDVDGMKYMLQYNNYQTDPLSRNTSAFSISARYDLITNITSVKQPGAYGGLDTKITSFSLMQKGSIVAISGPTHQNQLPFTWQDSRWANISHVGLPEVWNFDWVTFTCTVQASTSKSDNKNN